MLIRKIGLVVADEGEYEPLRRLVADGDKSLLAGMECLRFYRGEVEVLAVLCGIGKVNAAAATAFLLDRGVELLMSVGYSGGISGIAKGMTAVATRFLEHDFDLTPLGYRPAQKPDPVWIYDADGEVNNIIRRLYPDIREGTMVTGDCFVSDDKVRCWLSDEFAAVSCDMETAAVAAVGHKLGVKAVAIRRISDDAGDNANELYKETTATIEDSLMEMALSVIDAINEG